MTISFSDLFTKIGKVGHLLNSINTDHSSSYDTIVNELVTLFDTETNDQRAPIDGVLERTDEFGDTPNSYRSQLRTVASDILIQIVNEDNQQPSENVSDSLDELIRQMEAGSESVDASEPSVVVTADAGNTGTATVICSLLDGEGKTLENCLAEDIIVEVTSTATSGSESCSVKGEAQDTQDKLHHKWPSGSGSSKTTAVRNPSSAGFLTNGDFEAFTSDTPDNFTVVVGVAATDFDDSATSYRGSLALELDGDGATLTQLYQDLSSAALISQTPYPISIRYKVDVTPAAGALVIDLHDGSSVINDDEGTANSITIDLTAATTSWAVATGAFRLPEPVPAIVRLRLRLSTAISNTSSAFLDDLIMGPAMTEVYAAGPYVSVIRGDTDPADGDRYTVAITNGREGAFQELFDKFFSLPRKLLPSLTGGSETINDSLIS